MPLTRKVWEYMVKEPPTVAPSDSVAKAMKLLGKLNQQIPGIQSLIVADPNTGALKGVVTLRRIMEGLRKSLGRLPVDKGLNFWEIPELHSRLRQETELVKVKDVMSRNIYQVKPFDTVGKAVDLMLEKKVRGVPVVENQRVIGVIRMADFFEELYNQLLAD
jgi:CBS domain-containing protein